MKLWNMRIFTRAITAYWVIYTTQPAEVVGNIKAIPTSLPKKGRNTRATKDIVPMRI